MKPRTQILAKRPALQDWIFLLCLFAAPAALAQQNICAKQHLPLQVSAHLQADPEHFIFFEGLAFRLVSGSEAANYLEQVFMPSLRSLGKPESFYEKIHEQNQFVQAHSVVLLMYEMNDLATPVGGAAFVVARGADQSLAFEKELSLEPSTGTTSITRAEVARVAVSPGVSQSQHFRRLIDMIMQIARQSPDIQKFYAFTSRAHAALYARFGYATTPVLSAQQIPSLEKDLVLEIQTSNPEF